MHHRIYLVLRDEVLRGRYTFGGAFPPETSLTARFSTSRTTLRTALARLELEGLIERRQGRGTTCVHDPARSGAGPVRGMIENLIAMGLRTSVTLLAQGMVPATQDIAAALRTPRDGSVHRAVRIRCHEGRPFSHLLTHVPADVSDGMEIEALGNRPLLMLIEEGGHQIVEADQWISATAADPEMAPHLDVAVGAPLIQLTRIVYGAARRPFEHLVAHYRPDRYTFALTLERQSGVDAGHWRPRE